MHVCQSGTTRHSVAHLSIAVEPEDLLANTGCSSSLNLMEMSEEIESRPPPPIVQFPLGENTQERALPSLHIPQHCHLDVDKLLVLWDLSNKYLSHAPLNRLLLDTLAMEHTHRCTQPVC